MTDQFTPKVTTILAARIVEAASAGVRYARIAEATGVSTSTISRVVIRNRRPEPEPGGACGSNAGYFRHLRKREVACLPCLAAHASHRQTRRRSCSTT